MNIAELMAAEPMGLQFGLLPDCEMCSNFGIIRSGDRATLGGQPVPRRQRADQRRPGWR